MEISILLMKKIAQLFLMIFLGFLLVKSKLLSSKDSRALSCVTLYVVIPCVIVDSFQVTYTPDKMQGLLLAVLGAVIVHVVWLLFMPLCRKWLHFDEVEQASILYSNAGNLIIPIVTSVLGKQWVLYTSAYMSVQLVLIWSHGKSLLCREKGIDLKKVFSNVNMISVIVGAFLFVTRIQLPQMIGDTLSSVGSMIGPLSMIVTGMLIGGISFREVFGSSRIYLVTAFRLLIFPTIILVILKFSGIARLSADGETILLITLLACMTPSASTVTQMAQVYGGNAGYASGINVVSTMFCIVTMPVLVMLYLL